MRSQYNGGGLQMEDCGTSRRAFGPIEFDAHDFEEWLKIPITLARELQVEREVEGKQCVSVHFPSGICYASNKRKGPPPSRDAAKQLSKEVRLTEYNACDLLFQMGHAPTNSIEYELFMASRDVYARNHDLDYRGFYLRAIDILRDSGCALRVFDVFLVRTAQNLYKLIRSSFRIMIAPTTLVCWHKGDTFTECNRLMKRCGRIVGNWTCVCPNKFDISHLSDWGKFHRIALKFNIRRR